MTQSRRKSKIPTRQEWASAISDLRRTFKLSQTSFGKKFHSSAMAVSRWERGAQSPPPAATSNSEISPAIPAVGISGDGPGCATKT